MRCLVVFLSAVVVFFVLLIGLAILRPNFRRKVWRYAFTLSLIFVCSATYGVYRGSLSPEGLSSTTYGEPVTIVGTVLRQTVAGQTVYMSLVSIAMRSQHAGPEQWSPLQANIDATVHTVSPSRWQIGDVVTLNGFFQTPHQTKRGQSTPPVLVWLNPVLSFSGSVTSVQSPKFSVWMDVRQQIDRLVNGVAGQRNRIDVNLLKSIVFGGSDVAQQDKQAFLAAGLMHVLAASGANVLLFEWIVLHTVLPLARILRCPRIVQVCGIVLSVWVFSGICGFGPSILRAAWMSSFAYVSHYVQRPIRTSTKIGLAALAMAIVNPKTLWTASAWLSFCATFGIARALSRDIPMNRKQFRYRWRAILMWPIQQVFHTLRLTFFVELYTTPMTLMLFGQWTPYAMVANLVAEPVLWMLLPVCTVYILLALIVELPWLSFLHVFTSPMSVLVFGLLHGFLFVVRFLAHAPHALVLLTPPPMLWFGFYYCMLFSSKRLLRYIRFRC